MNLNPEPTAQRSILEWAVEKRADIMVSCATDEGWINLRSQFIRFDPEQGLLQITYPMAPDLGAPPELTVGMALGISFRRSHKKCLFVSPIVMRRVESDENGDQRDTLILRTPEQMRELQRRAYQRVTIPSDHFIAVKLWEGGVPDPQAVAWPLCSGRVANMSMGGVLMDIRADQNPRLRVGDVVGIEITVRTSSQPIVVEGRYRHCVMHGKDRLGLGFQFLGLEHEVEGRSSIMEVAEFVRNVRLLR
ncbi:MAG: PilZ domain-containing protein [Phycisphaerales bacterium]|nr:PilZ domain-containing protein [Phycisphaerales bacterium]